MYTSSAKETGVQTQLLEHIRADVDYWYPLDMNLGGKEHMTVHFPAFLMNHVAILPQQKWPKGIFVNWYVIGKAGKISKSKGGAQPIPGAAEKYGVDSLRLYYAHIASPFADVEWDEEIIENYMSHAWTASCAASWTWPEWPKARRCPASTSGCCPGWPPGWARSPRR